MKIYMIKPCIYCGRFYKKNQDSNKCKSCENEYTMVLEKLNNKQGSATCQHNHKLP